MGGALSQERKAWTTVGRRSRKGYSGSACHTAKSKEKGTQDVTGKFKNENHKMSGCIVDTNLGAWIDGRIGLVPMCTSTKSILTKITENL
jgi:hypothetical protein